MTKQLGEDKKSVQFLLHKYYLVISELMHPIMPSGKPACRTEENNDLG